MKRILCLLLVLIGSPVVGQTTYEGLLNSLEVKITAVTPSGRIDIVAANSSRVPIKIWSEEGDRGAARWRVLRIRNGQLETFFQHPNQNFTRNVNAPVEIPAGGHIQERLDLNGGNWCGFGHCTWFNKRGFDDRMVDFKPGDIVIVSYDVPRTNEAIHSGVWYGVKSALTKVD